MADIELRFHHDMLVLSSPLNEHMRRQGFSEADGLELLCVTEEEAVEEALRLEMLAGAQCLVTPTAGITEARLAHQRLESNAKEVLEAAMSVTKRFKPQHVIAEIESTGLPIDPDSKSSLMANRDQYSQAAKLFEEEQVDAFLLNNLYSLSDLRCALMGVRRVSDRPIMASVKTDAQGMLLGRNQSIEDAVAVMVEYEANVVGVTVKADLEDACALVRRMAAVCSLPLLVQLEVNPETSKLPKHTHEDPYWSADTMVQALLQLRAAGAQFVRAVGKATPSYTGALATTAMGLSCIR